MIVKGICSLSENNLYNWKQSIIILFKYSMTNNIKGQLLLTKDISVYNLKKKTYGCPLKESDPPSLHVLLLLLEKQAWLQNKN